MLLHENNINKRNNSKLKNTPYKIKHILSYLSKSSYELLYSICNKLKLENTYVK